MPQMAEKTEPDAPPNCAVLPEKMFAGKLYDPFCEGMPEARRRAHELCLKYNQLPESDEAGRAAILDELMPDRGEGVYLQGGRFSSISARTSAWAGAPMPISTLWCWTKTA